jgi:hypothetical protein
MQAKSLLQENIKSLEMMKANPVPVQPSELELIIRDLEMVIEKLNYT